MLLASASKRFLDDDDDDDDGWPVGHSGDGSVTIMLTSFGAGTSTKIVLIICAYLVKANKIINYKNIENIESIQS